MVVVGSVPVLLKGKLLKMLRHPVSSTKMLLIALRNYNRKIAANNWFVSVYVKKKTGTGQFPVSYQVGFGLLITQMGLFHMFQWLANAQKVKVSCTERNNNISRISQLLRAICSFKRCVWIVLRFWKLKCNRIWFARCPTRFVSINFKLNILKKYYHSRSDRNVALPPLS